MHTISVINYKGGVGKTTVTANLAAELSARGNRVLAVDLDPQTSLTFSFIPVDEWRDNYSSRTIKNWYDAFINENPDFPLTNLVITPPRVNSVVRGRLDIISSHLSLINVDLELSAKIGGGSPVQYRNNFLKVYSKLKNGLSSMPPYDYVLIDCPPNFNIVTRSAVIASDYLLVPAKPDYLSTLGIDELKFHVAEFVRYYNQYARQAGWQDGYSTPNILGVLFTMITVHGQQPISSQRQYIQATRNLSIPVLDSLIRLNNTIFADAPAYGVPVVLKSASTNTQLQVRSELEELADEFVRLVG